MGVVDFVDEISRLYTEHSEWSQKTFGSDDERGPVGPLKHLAKEAKEAAEATDRDELLKELADCFLLLLDANRRGKFTVRDLIRASLEKMEVNRNRKWPAPTKDEPVEHVREEEELEAFCLSTDGEHYDSRFPTEQEAIDEAVAWGCEVFYIGQPEKPVQPESFWSANEWIETVCNHDDYTGDYAEGWYCGTREQEKELEEQVRPVLAAWLDRHKLRPKHWLINSSTKYIVVEGQVMTEAELNGMEE